MNICKVNGFCIDVEILYLAKIFNISVLETGVTWTNDTRSSVKLLNDSLTMFVDLLKIKSRKY